MSTCFNCERQVQPPSVSWCGQSDCAAVARAKYKAQFDKRHVELLAQEAMARGDLETHLRRVGVPMERVQNLRATSEGFQSMEAARSFIRLRQKLLLILIGPPGVGKTVAAATVVKDACERWPWNSQATGQLAEPAAFMPASQLTSLSSFEHVDQERLRYLRRVPLLVLDEAGEEATQYGRGLLMTLLSERHAAGRRSVVTSNLTVEAFRERYGTALLDRVKGDGVMPDLSGQKSLRRTERPES